jgi:hypothetical protein
LSDQKSAQAIKEINVRRRGAEAAPQGRGSDGFPTFSFFKNKQKRKSLKKEKGDIIQVRELRLRRSPNLATILPSQDKKM